MLTVARLLSLRFRSGCVTSSDWSFGVLPLVGTYDIPKRTLRMKPKFKAFLVTFHCHCCENMAVREAPREAALATVKP